MRPILLLLCFLLVASLGFVVNPADKVAVERYKKSNAPNVYDDVGDDERPNPADNRNKEHGEKKTHETIGNDTKKEEEYDEQEED